MVAPVIATLDMLFHLGIPPGFHRLWGAVGAGGRSFTSLHCFFAFRRREGRQAAPIFPRGGRVSREWSSQGVHRMG